MSLVPGTPLGIDGHIPHVPREAGVAPWCSCGHRWNPHDITSLTVGEHIAYEASKRGVAVNRPGVLI